VHDSLSKDVRLAIQKQISIRHSNPEDGKTETFSLLIMNVIALKNDYQRSSRHSLHQTISQFFFVPDPAIEHISSALLRLYCKSSAGYDASFSISGHQSADVLD